MNEWLLQKFNEIESEHWWWKGRRLFIKLFVQKLNPVNILDVGCGTGETLVFLNKLFNSAKLYGVDKSSKAIEFAKKRGNFVLKIASAEKLPFEDESMDLIMLLDVLEHVEDQERALNEARRVLRKGGCLIITSPALPFIWSRHDSEQGHYRRYTKEDVKKLVKLVGFGVILINYFNFFLAPFIIALRVLSKLSLFEKIANFDNGINYGVVKSGFINSLLAYIFCVDVYLSTKLSFPFGISIGAVLVKK